MPLGLVDKVSYLSSSAVGSVYLRLFANFMTIAATTKKPKPMAIANLVMLFLLLWNFYNYAQQDKKAHWRILPPVMCMAVKLCNDLKVAIIRAGKTNVQVAREVGVKPQFISDIITGRKNPSLILALKLLKSVGKGPEQLNEIFWLEQSPGRKFRGFAFTL